MSGLRYTANVIRMFSKDENQGLVFFMSAENMVGSLCCGAGPRFAGEDSGRCRML